MWLLGVARLGLSHLVLGDLRHPSTFSDLGWLPAPYNRECARSRSVGVVEDPQQREQGARDGGVG